MFDNSATYDYFTSRFASGAVVKRTHLTEEFDFNAFRALYGEEAMPLFLIDEAGTLIVLTADDSLTPAVGQILISVVNPVEAERTNSRPTTTGEQGRRE